MPAPLYGSPSPYPDSPAAFLPPQFQIQRRRNEGRTLAAKKSGDPAGSTDALDSLSCIRNFSGRIQSCSTVVFAVKPPFGFRFMRNCERNFCFEKNGNNQEFLTDRIHRRYGMRDPCDSEESVRKTKDLESDVKA